MKIFKTDKKQKQKGKFLNLGAKALIFLALFLLPNMAMGYTQNDLNDVNKEIQEAQNSLKNTQLQKKSLQGEVNNYNNQISSIEMQISKSNIELNRLNLEITNIESNIISAEKELNKTKNELGEIVRTMYEEGQISDIELIAKSKNFSEFVNRAEYVESIQIKIAEVVDKVTNLKKELESKKNQLENNKKTTEYLKNEQLAQKKGLDIQKSQKNDLLLLTKGNESEFQSLIKELQKEYNQIVQSIWGSGTFISQGRVSRGSVIGYEGSTGLSTGAHLHFEYRLSRYSPVNPWPYLNNNTISNPLPGARITQDYGYVCWWTNSDGSCGSPYTNNLHTGIDYSKPAGSSVLAAADGDIVVRTTGKGNYYTCRNNGGTSSYCNSVAGGYGNYVIIQHDNGAFTLYGHLQ